MDIKSIQNRLGELCRAYAEDAQAVRSLLEQLNASDAPGYERDDGGRYPLHNASERGHLSIMRLLVEDGADIECETDSGYTPLIMAAWSRNIEAVRLLAEAGADINAANDEWMSALHWAAKNNDEAMIEFLVGLGADINIGMQESIETPLHMAFLCNNEAAAVKLVELGADLDARDINGQTAFDHNVDLEIKMRAKIADEISGQLNEVKATYKHPKPSGMML